MFYISEHSSVLRLGDVVEGYVSTHPTIISPCASITQSGQLANIDIALPAYSVVLSPCCSIDSGVICLTPLIEIDNKILRPPFFKEDPTRINEKVEPELSLPPSVWNNVDFQGAKQKLLAKGQAYAFGDYFVYEKNDIFSEYVVNMRGEDNIVTKYYMIDFRKIYSLMCDMIKRSSDLTDDDRPLIESKRLELSGDARLILREKLSYYFYRPAPEDAALIDSVS